MNALLLLAAWGALNAPTGSLQDRVAKTDPLPPSEELKKLKVPPGFEVQLVAAEPDIYKPMNLAFDRRGRLWVTSSVEYPFPAKEKGRDRVTILEDFGPDGRARKVTQFAEDLNIPIGLLPIGDGAIVHSIPHLIHLEDTAGDGKADRRTTVLGTFGAKDTHGMTNAFRRGLDGWIYATHGFANTSTLKASDGSSITLQSGNTYRFRADGSRVEQYTWGQVNPFGLAFDPLGNLYSADCHSKPVYMLLRGAYYPSFGKPHDGLGFAPEMCAHNHGSTGIGGVVYYAADHFPEEYRDTIFLGNPVSGRINHDEIAWSGSSPRAVLKPDFLVPEDPWFHPVDLRLGPDGALYVADFYNRIIGHYEVPLTHPGRDRHRGRIWRIVRKDRPLAPVVPEGRSAEQLAGDLSHPNFAVATAASHELVDRKAEAAARSVWAGEKPAAACALALTVLERLGKMEAGLLGRAAKDPSVRIRVTALRILSERGTLDEAGRALLLAGLKDGDGFVRRAAADALGQHLSEKHVRPLLSFLSAVPGNDPQLRHTARMALRNQLREAAAWNGLSVDQIGNPADAHTVADIALGVAGTGKAAYLLAYLKKFDPSQERRLPILAAIARDGTDETVRDLIEFARLKGKGREEQMIEIILAVLRRDRSKGIAADPGFRSWASEVALSVLANAERKGRWTFRGGRNPWVISSRPSTDGKKTNRLLSSFPLGEKLTGTVRSPVFDIPARLSFFIAGHNGFPGKPDHGKNRIVLRRIDTNEIVARAGPPRNDTARPVTWDLAAHEGKKGILEATDGDGATAYAWMAFGRLDPPVVELPDRQASGAGPLIGAVRIAGRLGLKEASPQLRKIALRKPEAPALRQEALTSLVAADPDSDLSAHRTVLGDAASAMVVRERAAQVLGTLGKPEAYAILVKALASSPGRLERVIALSLTARRAGGEALLKAVEAGKASARLLQDRAVVDRLNAAQVPDLSKRIPALTAGLPPATAQTQKLIASRKNGFRKATPDLAQGRQILEKTCLVCHQLKGQGKNFAPSLDAIGARGIDRLLEDILDPNRNVDQNFRTTLLRLDDGTILNGLLLREEGDAVVIVDDEKKERRIPKTSISARKRLPTSPMLANVASLMSEKEFYDLLGYLLAQKGDGKHN